MTNPKQIAGEERTLLEMAARAAGMFVLPEPWPEVDGWFYCLKHGMPALHFRKFGDLNHYTYPWMPINDDGDALRLAVKVNLTVDASPSGACASFAGTTFHVWAADHNGDHSKCARLAITRAAASIGASMKEEQA